MSTTLLAPKPETIGRKIAEKRRELDMSQGDLAREVGLTQAALCRIEKGHAAPRRTTMRCLAIALKLDLSPAR